MSAIDARALAASPLGFLIGLSLGALGGGGSILAVPALVYAAGQDPRAATTTSLVLVSATALIGIVPHRRAGRVRFASGAAFSLAGVAGSLLGSAWNESVDPDVLLLAFAGLMLVVASAMWRRARATATGSGGGARGGVASTVLKVLAAGSVVGLLTGFFGVGGGFVIVPALVLSLGYSMPEAVGTSLLVITVNSVVALLARLDGAGIEWSVVVPFMAASLLGLRVGTAMASSRDPRTLQRWFVYLLVAVALYTAGDSIIAMG
jgi:uncharacterized membrane protein YfcA